MKNVEEFDKYLNELYIKYGVADLESLKVVMSENDSFDLFFKTIYFSVKDFFESRDDYSLEEGLVILERYFTFYKSFMSISPKHGIETLEHDKLISTIDDIIITLNNIRDYDDTEIKNIYIDNFNSLYTEFNEINSRSYDEIQHSPEFKKIRNMIKLYRNK